MDIAIIQSTISGLQTANDIAKAMFSLKASANIQGKVIQLQAVILSAQVSTLSAHVQQLEAFEEIRKLKEEITKIKSWDSEKHRYKLISSWYGSVAYALKPSMSNSEPSHFIYTKSFEDGKNHSQAKKDTGEWTLYSCPVCKSEVPTGHKGHVEPEYVSE